MIEIFELLKWVQVVVGVMVVFILPGLAWSLVIFPKRKLDVVQRLIISIWLSVVITPSLLLIYNRLLGRAINTTNVAVLITLVTATGLVVYLIRVVLERRRFKLTL